MKTFWSVETVKLNCLSRNWCRWLNRSSLFGFVFKMNNDYYGANKRHWWVCIHECTTMMWTTVVSTVKPIRMNSRLRDWTRIDEESTNYKDSLLFSCDCEYCLAKETSKLNKRSWRLSKSNCEALLLLLSTWKEMIWITDEMVDSVDWFWNTCQVIH